MFWHRNGLPLLNGSKYYHTHGVVLQIKNVDWTDMGTYLCTVLTLSLHRNLRIHVSVQGNSYTVNWSKHPAVLLSVQDHLSHQKTFKSRNSIETVFPAAILNLAGCPPVSLVIRLFWDMNSSVTNWGIGTQCFGFISHSGTQREQSFQTYNLT